MEVCQTAQQKKPSAKWKDNLLIRENIYIFCISDKWLISKIYEELIQLNSKPPPTTQLKMSRGTQRKLTNCQQVYEKLLNITKHQNIRKMYIKTKMRYYHTWIIWVYIKVNFRVICWKNLLCLSKALNFIIQTKPIMFFLYVQNFIISSGKPGVLQLMGSQWVRHDLATEQQQYFWYLF